MSIRAVKDNRASREVCVYVCVLESGALGVESERQKGEVKGQTNSRLTSPGSEGSD